jgi:hypothetical protein
MGLCSGEGLELVGIGRPALLCLRYTRRDQHHVDVVGRIPDVQDVVDWCEEAFGRPSRWIPLTASAQWHNRYDTDIAFARWSCLWPPWGGGDVAKVHLVLGTQEAKQFNDRWRAYHF